MSATAPLPVGSPPLDTTLGDITNLAQLHPNLLSASNPPSAESSLVASSSQLGLSGDLAVGASIDVPSMDEETWDRRRKLSLLHQFLSLNDAVAANGFVQFIDKKGSIELLCGFIANDHNEVHKLEESRDFEDQRYAVPRTLELSALEDADLSDLKRAHKAVMLMSTKNASVDNVLQRRVHEIVAPCLRAFLGPAGGRPSAFHVCAALDTAMRLNPHNVAAYLSEGPRVKHFLNGMLENLHFSPVVDTLLRIVTLPIPSASPSAQQNLYARAEPIGLETQKAFLKRLSQWNPVGILVKRVTECTAASTELEYRKCVGAFDFLRALIIHFDGAGPTEPESMAAQYESTLLKPLLSIPTIDALVRSVGETPEQQQQAHDESVSEELKREEDPALSLLTILAQIAATGRVASTKIPGGASTPFGDDADAADLVDAGESNNTKKEQASNAKNRLKALQEEKRKQQELEALSHVVPQRHFERFASELRKVFSSAVVGGNIRSVLETSYPMESKKAKAGSAPSKHLVAHTSYAVDRPFGYKRMAMVAMIGALSDTPEKLRTMVPWSHLVNWIGAYPNNSILLSEFTKVFKRAMLAPEDAMDAAKIAICDCKLVTHLVNRLTKFAKETDHGHVAQCMNVIRLRVDTLSQKHWLAQYLKSHSGWATALPVLLQVTRDQLRLEIPEGDEGPAKALFRGLAADAGNPLMKASIESAAKAAQDEEIDIELGSAFAKSLGFTASMTPAAVAAAASPAAASKKTAQPAEEDDFDESLFEDEEKPSGGAGGGGGKKKKAKKKKR